MGKQYCSVCDSSYKLKDGAYSPIGYHIMLLGYCTLFCLRTKSDMSIEELEKYSEKENRS